MKKSDYYILKTYDNSGIVGISRRAFENIATLACNQVVDAKVSSRKKNRFFSLARPVKVSFRKDGKIGIAVEVDITSPQGVQDTCLKIQEAIASAISMSCEAVPFSIEVKVASIGNA